MKSQLYLETEARNGRTIIKDVYFTAPYKIMSPFEEDNYKDHYIEIMQMSASAGLLEGDIIQGDFLFRENSHVFYTSQSYEKIFRCKEAGVRKNLKIQVEQGAKIVYLPQPVIPFGGSVFQGDTQIYLEHPEIFVYGEVVTCGRSGMGEKFQMNCYESKCRIYVDEQLVFADHTLLHPQQLNYQNMGMWGEYTHNGLLYIYVEESKKEERLLMSLQKMCKTDAMLLGVTKCFRGILLRALAKSGDEIYETFKQACSLIA